METSSDLLVLPFRLEVDAPERYARVQVLLRALVLVVLTMLCQSGLGLWALAYAALPLLAAVLIDRHGSAGYLERAAPQLLGSFEWLAGLVAYMLFVTDRLPLGSAERPLRIRARAHGQPSVRSALGRLVTSLPHFALIALVMVICSLLCVFAALSVLLSERFSEGLRSFQQEIVAWIARVLVYHASLVPAFPPLDVRAKPSLEKLSEA